MALRLQIDPRHIARLRNHPRLKRAADQAARKLHNVHYDTDDLDLWRAGVALRLRRAGNRWTQTVWKTGSAAAGYGESHESAAEVATPFPDCSIIGDPALAAQFSSPELRARLKPVFVTEFTRACRTLEPEAGVTIAVNVDRGFIRSGNTTEPFCELGLEIVKGPAWWTYRAALQLLETVPLLIESRSKAERGVAMRQGVLRQPRNTPPSPVMAGMSSNDAFKALLQSCLAHYTANQRGMLTEHDPEYLHQMRVAIRRLRSVFSTFSPLLPAPVLQPPKEEVRWLARMMAPARDWDVFATETLPLINAHTIDHIGMIAVTRAATRLRQAANRATRRAVTSARGQGVLLSLGGWLSAETWREALDDAQCNELQRPAADFARTKLDTARKRVLKDGKHFATLTPPELHRLRITAKKLRYASEFFAPLYDAHRARGYRSVLARLQDALGIYNDAVTVKHLAERATRGLEDAVAIEARGILLGWSAGRQDAGTRQLERIWKEFRAARPFWI